MSLINKMLQDLDARGTQGGEAMPTEIRPVARAERRLPLPVVLVSAVSALALAGGGYAAWRYYQQRAVPAVPVKAAPKLAPAPVRPPASAPVVVAPVAAALPAPAAVAASAPGPGTANAPLLAAAVPAVAAPAAASVAAVEPTPPAKTRQPEAPKAPAKKKAIKQPKVLSKKEAKELARKDAALKAAAIKAAARAAPKPAAPKAGGAVAAPRAEPEYRRALGAIAEGRIGDGIAALEQVLRIDPRHEGARQTLVGLLIEARRTDDAMRHLQAALALDPRQPSMAMLLARLQIERGGNGIETLQRTLPSAAGKPDYHAFLAGALQRAQRYREAAEQYQAAVRGAPQNGVWLMGMGLALQGDGRNAEALDAFQRARATGSLSADLQGFVERKIAQLSR